MSKAENDDEHELAALETTVATLRSLKSAYDSAEHLKATEVPDLKEQLTELEEKRTSAVEALETVSTFYHYSSMHYLGHGKLNMC
jgi:DNA repair protein RAD50